MALAAALFFVAPARATLISSNFGAAHSYSAGTTWTIAGTNAIASYSSPAMDFTPGSNFVLTQIDVAVGWQTGTNAVTISLESSRFNAFPSDTVLEAWTVTNLPKAGSCCTIQTLLSTPISLTMGTQYWIVMSAAAADTWAGWYFNSTVGPEAVAIKSSPSAEWNVLSIEPAGAFDIQGYLVPEPGTVLLAAGGLGFLAALRRNRS